MQATAKQPLKVSQDESTRIHRAINWVVSVILIVFAVWSINLNAEAKSYLKQSVAIIAETDSKLLDFKSDLEVIKRLCQPTTVVIPPTPIDTIE